jgi:hypothetical protein
MVDEVNDAPVASDDVATTPEDLALTITAAALVGNDTDLEGQTLGVTAVGAAVNGTVALAAGRRDLHADRRLSRPGVVHVHGVRRRRYRRRHRGRHGHDRPPTRRGPVADAFDATEDTARTIPTAQLTSNDLDPDGDALTVTAVANPLGGTVTLAGGVATFTPAPNLTGVAGFDYTVSDGGLTAQRASDAHGRRGARRPGGRRRQRGDRRRHAAGRGRRRLDRQRRRRRRPRP